MQITLDVGVQYTSSGIAPSVSASDSDGQTYSITPEDGGGYTVKSMLHGDDSEQTMPGVPFDSAWRGLAVSFGLIEP